MQLGIDAADLYGNSLQPHLQENKLHPCLQLLGQAHCLVVVLHSMLLLHSSVTLGQHWLLRLSEPGVFACQQSLRAGHQLPEDGKMNEREHLAMMP